MLKKLPANIEFDAAALISRSRTAFLELSLREKMMVMGGFLFLIGFAFYLIAVPIAGTFSSQRQRIAKLESELKMVNILLNRYTEFKQRLSLVEARYKKPGKPEGIRSYLASLSQLARIPEEKLEIRDGPKLSLGDTYQQTPFTIKFETTSLADIVRFLQGVQFGPGDGKPAEPLLMTKLEIETTRRREKLKATIDVSSVTNAG